MEQILLTSSVFVCFLRILKHPHVLDLMQGLIGRLFRDRSLSDLHIHDDVERADISSNQILILLVYT